MRPILDAAGCLCVYLLSPTGGVVQGDRYHIDITVGEGSHALFTTQSATKVYRMPDGCAEQIVRVDVGRDAVFEYVPDAAILFAEADFHQHAEFTLQPGALALICEVIMPGRLARDEFLAFRRFVSRNIVRDADGLILHESARLGPAASALTAVGRLEGYACWGSAYLVGDLAARGIEAATFAETHKTIFERDGVLTAASPLHRNGIGVKVLSQHIESIYAVFNELRAVLRTRYLHLPAAPLRK